MLGKGVKPLLLIYLFRFIGEDDRVAVEGNTDLLGVTVGINFQLAFGAYDTRRKAGDYSLLNVLLVCGEKEIGAKGLQIRSD